MYLGIDQDSHVGVTPSERQKGNSKFQDRRDFIGGISKQVGNFQMIKSGSPAISHRSVPLCWLNLHTQCKHSPVGDKISYSLTALKQYKAMNRLLILLSQSLSLELDVDLLKGRVLTFKSNFVSQTQYKLKNCPLTVTNRQALL